jgi:hypothetical protein
MNSSSAIGLGEPEGKKSLFQPPNPGPARSEKIDAQKASGVRMRMTLEMTRESLEIVQRHQSQYRLEYGHALPKWKIISDALVMYDKTRKGEANEAK